MSVGSASCGCDGSTEACCASLECGGLGNGAACWGMWQLAWGMGWLVEQGSSLGNGVVCWSPGHVTCLSASPPNLTLYHCWGSHRPQPGAESPAATLQPGAESPASQPGARARAAWRRVAGFAAWRRVTGCHSLVQTRRLEHGNLVWCRGSGQDVA